MLMILPATSWLHSFFFFPQRSDVNLFASIQAAVSMYTHRSLYDITPLTPLHVASRHNRSQPWDLAASTAAARLSFNAHIWLKGCSHYSQGQHFCTFSWPHHFDSSSNIAASSTEVRRAAAALAQLSASLLSGIGYWVRLIP